MENKVILVLFDGMRADVPDKCENKFLYNLKEKATTCYKSQTVIPSVTLPCHTSLFLSVDPERHGITNNIWMAQVRPIDSIFDVVAAAGGKCAMVHDWLQLRDLAKPKSLHFDYYRSFAKKPLEDTVFTEKKMTDVAIDYIKEEMPDFIFIYYAYSDEAGHKYGWMTDEYISAISSEVTQLERLVNEFGDDYHIIVTADHGGHDRTHGTTMPEDMTIPITFFGKSFEAGRELDACSIKDIAPTVTTLLGIEPADEWEGKSVI